MKALSKRVQSNFDSHWVADPVTGCWNWTGAVTKAYGCLKVFGKTQKAHRFSYERVHGPIPKSMHVLHNCDNGLCVNPDHLRLGTHADNMRDRSLRTYRNPFGEKAAHARLTQAEVDAIRTLYSCGALQRVLAERFGTSTSNISDIVRRRSWPEVAC